MCDLVELVDQTDSSVGQHQSSSLQRPLSADWVSLDVSSQAHSRGPLTSGEDRAGRHLLHVPAGAGGGKETLSLQKLQTLV